MAEHPDSPSTTLVVGVVREQSDDVVRQAVRFATLLNASLVLATVDPSRYTTGRNDDGSITAFPIDPDAAEVITEEFEPEFADHLRRLVEPAGVDWTMRALAGDPAHELARLAHEVDALAIVVGTRKPGLRTSAHEFFNGSVAVHLAHRQHHPVIVIPIAPVAGATIGSLIHVPPAVIGLYLGYFAGFLLYLATADILPEAHAGHPSRLTLLCTVAGTAFMFGIAVLNRS